MLMSQIDLLVLYWSIWPRFERLKWNEMKLLLLSFSSEAFPFESAIKGQREQSVKNAGQEWVIQCEAEFESIA